MPLRFFGRKIKPDFPAGGNNDFNVLPVDIITRSLERERRANLRVFRNQVPGRTSYARRCEILNEEDITFNYGSDRDTLIAYALKPLQIRNDALGYIIKYRVSFEESGYFDPLAIILTGEMGKKRVGDTLPVASQLLHPKEMCLNAALNQIA